VYGNLEKRLWDEFVEEGDREHKWKD
jgi:hypothetical protein